MQVELKLSHVESHEIEDFTVAYKVMLQKVVVLKVLFERENSILVLCISKKLTIVLWRW